MAEDAERLLAHFAERYQVFPNGFCHYLDRDSLDSQTRFLPRILKGAETSTEWKSLHEKAEGERIALPSEDFLHMYCEPSSNLAAGLLESLLQSHDGTIRVFPAVPSGKAAAFLLLAKGGFLVSSEKGSAGPFYVRIESTIGGGCSIALPWSPHETGARLRPEGTIAWKTEGNVARFETKPGDNILLYPKASPPESLYREGFRSCINEGPKRKGKASIGKERDF
jgi:alpha-L-fucosidase 2